MEGYMSALTLNPPTDKSKREAGAVFGAGLFIYGNMDVETFAISIQTNGSASRY
jgi:hypothetical protein